MASIGETGVESPEAKRPQKIGAFIAGIIFALLIIGAGFYLNPEETSDFIGGRYQLILMALFIGISTGHYLGISLGHQFDINVAAAIGLFLTLSIAFLYISIPDGFEITAIFSPGGLLVLSSLLLILGHYSHLIAYNQAISQFIKTLAERLSPALLAAMWFLEAILIPSVSPLISYIGFAEIGETITSGLQVLAILILFIFALIIISGLSRATSGR